MRLDVKKNLINLEMYFRDVLGYNCYWQKLTKEIENMHYEIQLDSEFLIIEVSSVLHMLKYCEDNMTYSEDGMTEQHHQIEKILSGDLPVPKVAYLWFGSHEEALHSPPCFMVSRMPYEHELYTSNRIKWIYNRSVSGRAGIKNLPILDYFLYCYDRTCLEFQSIPKETVNEIEAYFKKQGRPIFDTI